jgi:microcystin-dependent protein
MSEPFLGEIRMVGFNYAPPGWALCQGQTMAIASNSALFSLLGTTFGGDGVTNFKLPDYRSRSPVGMGQGPGLSLINQGQMSGTESVTLSTPQLPIHAPTATFTGAASAVTGTVDVATTTTAAMVPPTTGATTYLSATTAKAGPTNVAFNGLFTNTAPDATKAELGGVHVNVTPTGTVAINPVGGGLPVPTRNPYLGMNFIIATEGLYPSHQ